MTHHDTLPEAAAGDAGRHAGLPDVETDADVRVVVDAFYGGIEADPLLGPFFAGVDLEAHRPRLYAFWSSVVFHTAAYRGRPFDAHAALPGLAPEHFAGWLERFGATIDARYRGPHAEQMKRSARQIAWIFQTKLGLLEVLP